MKRGEFNVSIKGNNFSSVGFDEAHEMLINKDTKNIIVKSTPKAIGRICQTLQFQAQLVNNYARQVKCTSQHKMQRDLSHSVIRKEQNNVFLYYDKCCESDVFSDGQNENLYQAFSKLEATNEQVKHLMGFYEIGFESFVYL